MAATAVWPTMICIFLFLLISFVSISQGAIDDDPPDDDYYEERGDYDYNEPENFHMAEEPDSYDYPDNNDEDPNGLNPYFNGHAYNGEDEHFADDSVNEMNVKKTKKPKHLLKKTLKRKKAEQVRNTNPYQHSQETHSDHHTEQKLMKQKHSHKDHQQQRKVEQVQPKHKPNQQPQPKQNLQQKQNPHQNKQPTQGRQAQQKQQTQQSHQPTQSQQAQQSHQPTQSQQAQQSHQPTQSQQTQQSHQPTQSQQTQQSHQPTQSQQTQQSHQPTQSQQAQQSQQKQHSQQSQQPQVHQSEQKQLIESSMVHQQQQENDQQQHSQATSSNLQQNQQSSQQQNGIEENNIDSKDNKKTDVHEVEIVLSDISDSDPNINNILNSDTFRNVRKQQIKDYIKSHFANEPLQEGMLVSIDDLITSNLVKGLKDKDSRLNRILRESANVMDGANTPDEVTEDAVDSDTNKEDHVENIPETPAIPVESSVESTIKPTPLSQTISKEQEPQPKPPATKSIEIVGDSNENQVELHSKDDLVSKTVEETVDEHQIKRKNLMKNAMRGMHGNGHHHEHVHASDNHKHDHKVDKASISPDQTRENSKDDGHDIETLKSEDVDSSSEIHKENIKESEELLDLNEKQLESETLATEEKSSQGEHQGINLPEQQSEKDSEESVEPAGENKSSEEASEKSGFLGGIFDYFSGEASEKASDVATHDGLDKTLDKTTGNEPINELAINEPAINEPAINEPAINEAPINEPVINEPAINKPNVNELDIKKADVKEPISGEPSIHEPPVKEESLVNEEKSNQEENTSPKETPETSPTINEINDIRPSQLPSDSNEKKTEDEVFKPDDDDGKGDKNQEFLKEVKESVDMEHEKHKYTKEGQFQAQSQEIDKQSEANEDSSHSKEPKNPTTRDDPLYKLCEQHPTLQACKKINENTNQEQVAVNEAPKTLSSAGHIKAFTRWINSWIYFFFLYIFSCFKTMIIFMWTYSCGMFLSLIGQHEISQLVLNSINEMSIEKFAFILVFIVNHIIFYWYFKNSNMGPVVKVIRHSGQTKVVDNSKVDELQNDIKTLNETITKLEKDLQQESENKREVEEQISKLKEEKGKLSSELIELKNKLNEAEGEKEKVRELQDQIKQYKDVIEKLKTELRISNTTLDSTKEDLDTMKTDYKQLDDKFVYVIKELDTKDVAIGKMEENEKKVKEELEEQRRICKERDDTISEQNSRIDSLLEEKQNSESALEESNKRCHEYQLEIEVLQECLLAVNKVSVDHETSNEFDNVEDDQEIDEQLKAERLAKIMDATKAQAELKDIKDQYELCQEELKKYCDIANDSEAKYNDIWSKFEELSTEASELRKSLEKKDIELSTISKFFADRENDYQKAGMSQAEEIKILQKQIDSIGDNDKQINILLKQAQDLKEEIQTNEKQYKQQLSTVEEQSHNNYIKMRTAIRECEEHKREKEVYRKRLLDIDMTPKFKTAVKTSTPVSSKTPSERAASPTNSNKSVEENSRTESPRPSLPPAQPYGPRMYPGMPPPFSPRPPPPFGMPPMMGPYGVPPPRPYMPPPMNPARLPGSPAVSLANQPLRPRDQRPNASVMMHPHMASPLRPPPPHPLSQVRGMYPTPPHGTSPFSMPPRPPMADRTPHSNADGNQVINPENAGV